MKSFKSTGSTSSRRSFLKQGLTAFGAATLIPSGLQLGAVESSSKTAPSNRITLGFIGVGKQGGGLLGGFIGRNNVQVVAVCDVDSARREHQRKRVENHYAKQKASGSYKGCAAYNDFRELLARPDIDAVVIATPDHWHALIGVAAARAGKDIYCEKPLTNTIHEARALVNATRENNRVFQVGSQQRSSGEFKKVCEWVQNGRIGKVERVQVSVGGPSDWCQLEEKAAPEGLDWDLWLGPAPERGWNEVMSPVGVHNNYPMWRMQREYAGGMMTDWGAHHFDIAQWGLGMDHSGPVEILPPNGSAREFLTYRYANGVEMIHTPNTENGVTFYGTDGWIFVNRGGFKASSDDISKQPLGDSDVRLYHSRDHQGDFLECVISRKKPICDVEVGTRSVTVCHLGNLAYWNNRALRWNPETERFVKDPEANMYWLDINRRGEWQLT